MRGTCNYEMINTLNALQREYQITVEFCIAHFVVACSPGELHVPLSMIRILVGVGATRLHFKKDGHARFVVRNMEDSNSM
jgi:hypothetical protein